MTGVLLKGGPFPKLVVKIVLVGKSLDQTMGFKNAFFKTSKVLWHCLFSVLKFNVYLADTGEQPMILRVLLFYFLFHRDMCPVSALLFVYLHVLYASPFPDIFISDTKLHIFSTNKYPKISFG